MGCTTRAGKNDFNKEEFSRNLNSVLELARKSNIPIFFTSIQLPSKRFESSAIIYTLGKLGFDRLFEQFTAEDLDFTIKPKRNEMVVNKHTVSIFIDTGFERMLKCWYYYCNFYRYCYRIWKRV
jgi:nicotinamidase-related amidase